MTIKTIHTVGFYTTDGSSIMVVRATNATPSQYDVAVNGEWHARITATAEHGLTVDTGRMSVQLADDIMRAMFRHSTE